MRRLMAFGLLAVAGMSQAAVFAQWNFNGSSATTVPGGALSPTPSVGLGTASLLGVTASFSSGTANGGSSDPVNTTPNNYGWQTTGYAAQNVDSGTRGVQFAVSTVGQSDITVSFDTRHSNTSSRWVRFDYSADGGTNWTLGTVAGGSIFAGTAGDTWFNLRTVDLSSVAAVENNANFVFRMVTIFGPASGDYVDGSGYSAYAASTGTSTYATTGTLRWDMVTVNAVPEPGTMAALAIGGGLVALRRRRQK